MSDFTDGIKSKKERLAVLVSSPGMDEEQLLGIPAMDGATGEDVMEAVMGVLQEWNLDSTNVAGLSFDTTAVNTGQWKGDA